MSSIFYWVILVNRELEKGGILIGEWYDETPWPNKSAILLTRDCEVDKAIIGGDGAKGRCSRL